jgi:hypothetical protein
MIWKAKKLSLIDSFVRQISTYGMRFLAMKS